MKEEIPLKENSSITQLHSAKPEFSFLSHNCSKRLSNCGSGINSLSWELYFQGKMESKQWASNCLLTFQSWESLGFGIYYFDFFCLLLCFSANVCMFFHVPKNSEYVLKLYSFNTFHNHTHIKSSLFTGSKYQPKNIPFCSTSFSKYDHFQTHVAK